MKTLVVDERLETRRIILAALSGLLQGDGAKTDFRWSALRCWSQAKIEARIGFLGLVLAVGLHGSAIGRVPAADNAGAANVRLLVYKNLTSNRLPGTPLPPFAPVASTAPGDAGFVLIADYLNRSLYEGPVAAASGLLAHLSAQGVRAVLASDLDTLVLHDHRIDPDTGSATPPFPSSLGPSSSTEGVYIVVLRGYPTAAWLQDLRSRNVRTIEALPPAAYIARGPRLVITALPAQTSYVRAAFPILPGMKSSLALPSSESPIRHVLVQAVEETAQDTLKPYLDSVSARPAVLDSKLQNGRASYVAWLTDTDINTLTAFENVYSVTSVLEPLPSSERQGMIALAPVLNGGRLELPSPTLPLGGSYWSLLNSHGISDFVNTTVALLDTGFDDGSTTHPDFQYGNSPSVIALFSEFGTDTADNREGHGTLTASVITGFTAFNQRADAEQYRYSLGLAPGVGLLVDKFFSGSAEAGLFCGGVGDLSTALSRILQSFPNVINLSWNEGASCGYSALSQIVDQRSRTYGYLFTIAAGNSPDAQCPQGVAPNVVRGPATAKNGLAVGATENFTPGWSTFSSVGTCYWNGYPPAWGQVRDARNIPSFSAIRDSNSMVKPDIVAVGTRVTGPITRGTRCVNGDGSNLTIFCSESVDSFPPINYGMSAGTSFAAPAVAGAAAVIRKWYQNLTRSSYPSPAMQKAILINGARDIGGAPASPPCPAGAVRQPMFTSSACIGHIPDQYQGWGELNLDRLLGPASDYYFSDQAQHPIISPSTTYLEIPFVLNDSSRPVRITVVYSDAAGNLNGLFPYRVKNSINAIAYQNPCYPCWGSNYFDPATGVTIPSGFTPPPTDSVNNVQEIIIPAGSYASGTTLGVMVYTVSLVEDAIFGGGTPQQDFAIFIENGR